VFNSERVFGKHCVSGKPAPYWHKHNIDWVPTLQLAKKNYRAKLSHDANAERDERIKKRYELVRGRTRARAEAAENVESLWKAVFLVLDFSQPITSTEEEGNRNKGNEKAFFSDQSAIAVTEDEEIEPKTVKDAERQTIEFDYMFQTSRYQATNKDFFDTDVIVRFYTGLPSMEILTVVFEHVSWHVTRQTQSLNRSRIHYSYCTYGT